MSELFIVTPYGEFFEGKCNQITIPTDCGPVTILPNHSPIIGNVVTGKLIIYFTDKTQNCACSSGLFHVKENKIYIMVQSIEYSQSIDRRRAKKAKTRAEALIKQKGTDMPRAMEALKRANNRLEISAK